MEAEHQRAYPPPQHPFKCFRSGRTFSWKFLLPWALIYILWLVFVHIAPYDILLPKFQADILFQSHQTPSETDTKLILYSVPYDKEWHYVKPHRIRAREISDLHPTLGEGWVDFGAEGKGFSEQGNLTGFKHYYMIGEDLKWRHIYLYLGDAYSEIKPRSI